MLLAIARHKALSARRRTETELDERTASLPSEQGEVINLVYYHGKSVKEVAQIVGIPEATVKCSMRAQELAALIAQVVQPALLAVSVLATKLFLFSQRVFC
jgi:DNA-directed RNA polymerase specialized sigma subunit